LMRAVGRRCCRACAWDWPRPACRSMRAARIPTWSVIDMRR
jgi:hypothetical protein